MVEGNDGGACVSFNGGESFSTIYNQMTAQFYHMDIDDEFPYRVYGTQQDNSSVCVPSDTVAGPITWGDCEVVGTGESGYIAVKPDDVNTVYVGAVGSSPGGQGRCKVDRISADSFVNARLMICTPRVGGPRCAFRDPRSSFRRTVERTLHVWQSCLPFTWRPQLGSDRPDLTAIASSPPRPIR
jgi:hypothetical protein